MQRLIRILTIALLLAPTISAVSQAQTVDSFFNIAEMLVWRDLFDSLTERVKVADTAVDFLQWRTAYAKSDNYWPFEKPLQFFRDSLKTAEDARDNPKAAELATFLLTSNYSDLGLHLSAYKAYYALGDTLRMAHHRWVAYRLAQSMLGTGDGLTRETAYHVFDLTEERALVEAVGSECVETSRQEGWEHSYDEVFVRRPNQGDSITVFFNIDVPVAWLKDHPDVYDDTQDDFWLDELFKDTTYRSGNDSEVQRFWDSVVRSVDSTK